MPKHEAESEQLDAFELLYEEPDVMPGMRRTRGLFVDWDSGEAAFVPGRAFRQQSGLWRADVLGDLLVDVEYWRTLVLVDYFDELAARTPHRSMDECQQRFRTVCARAGRMLPPRFDELILSEEARWR